MSIIPLVEYVHPLGLLTSNLHSLRSDTAFRIGKKAWNIKSFVNMMELAFYMAMASICFATQIVSINSLNKRTLFCQVERNHSLKRNRNRLKSNNQWTPRKRVETKHRKKNQGNGDKCLTSVNM